MPSGPSLEDGADAFASSLLDLLNSTLPGNHRVSIERRNSRFIVHTASGQGHAVGHVPLYAKLEETPLASFYLSMSLRPDRTGRYLAVSQSKMVLHGTDRKPLVRLEFLDDARKPPCCHWQFHGENPAFEQLLLATRPRSKAARRLSALHFPVGGARMRPGIEDFLQFLIQECGFVAVEGWDAAIRASRTDWRLRQARTIARDAPRTVARALGEHLGVRVLRLRRLGKDVDDVPKVMSKW